jgi:prepilin-type N-terminal cleavage/methylation domain-containing protein
MKRQSFPSQSGFTLFELMIVITVFSIFVMITSSFDWRPQTDIEKADRMMIVVSSTLRTEMQNISIGKMPRRDGKTATNTTINISSGGLLTTYTSSVSGVIWSGAFSIPFFDGDPKYLIRSVTWTGSTTNTGTTGTGDLIITPQGVSFSGAGIWWTPPWYTMLEIVVGYNNASRKVTLDRRTGRIIESKQ